MKYFFEHVDHSYFTFAINKTSNGFAEIIKLQKPSIKEDLLC